MKRLKNWAMLIAIGCLSLSILSCNKPSQSPSVEYPKIEPCYIPPLPELATNADLVQYVLVVVGELRKCSEKVLLLRDWASD